MELRQLRYFVAVAEESNFTRAARRMHLVQSGVSAQIKALEREVGATLLERSASPVRLTDAGHALLPHARAALDAARSAQDAVDHVIGGLRGSVRIGTMTSLGRIDLAVVLGRFHATYPGVALNVRVSPIGTRGLIEWLLDGTIDVAFGGLGGPPPPGIDAEPLASTRLIALMPEHHRLADEPEIALADLADERFIDFPAGYGNRAITDRAFAALGITRHVALEIMGVDAVADFVRAGLGVTIIPESYVRPDSQLRAVPFAGDPLTFTFSFATASVRPPSAAVQRLRETVRSSLTAPAEE